MRATLSLAATLFLMVTFTGFAAAQEAPSEEWQDRLARQIPLPEDIVVVESNRGVAATLNAEASRAAVEVMEAGGNAMDAAVAAWFVLSVVTPNQTGLAGGGHIAYYEAATGQTYFVDAAQRAPMAAHPTVFLDDEGEPLPTEEIRARGLAVGVPGIIRGWDVALKRWGTRYFDELADRAIDLAENGWEVDRELALRIRQTQDSLDAHARAIYVPEGRPLEPGDLLVQEAKARALRLIARGGSDAFYQGEIAEAVARHVQALGGVLTVEDFQRFNVTVDPPRWVQYGDHQIATHPNTPGGNTFAVLMGLLEPFQLGQYHPRSVEHYHLLLEATRLASAESLEYFGGGEFMDHPWQATLSEEFLADRRALIRMDARMEDVEPADAWAYQVGEHYRTRGQHPDYDETAHRAPSVNPSDEGTDHLTIVDSHGNVVAATTSLGVGWIGGHMVPEYGFMLNVRGAYFDTEPGGVQEIRPGKRPRRSMTPTLVLRNGEPVFTVGSPSPGPMQHAQVLLNMIEHGMDPARAIAEPRIGPPGTWEKGVPENVLEALRELGHPMDEEWSDRGAVPVLRRVANGWQGASDPRREGTAMGVPPRSGGDRP